MKQIFSIIPGSSGSFWILGGASLILAGVICLFMFIAYSSRNTRFEVSADGLRIRGDIYGRTIPISALQVDEAKIVNLVNQPEYRLGWSSNSSRLPGYKAGWFRLGNGEKALVFITDKNRVVAVPTRNGYTVLMSVSQPDAFLHVLRQAGSAG